jgi:hypothetical protein
MSAKPPTRRPRPSRVTVSVDNTPIDLTRLSPEGKAIIAQAVRELVADRQAQEGGAK